MYKPLHFQSWVQMLTNAYKSIICAFNNTMLYIHYRPTLFECIYIRTKPFVAISHSIMPSSITAMYIYSTCFSHLNLNFQRCNPGAYTAFDTVLDVLHFQDLDNRPLAVQTQSSCHIPDRKGLCRGVWRSTSLNHGRSSASKLLWWPD